MKIGTAEKFDEASQFIEGKYNVSIRFEHGVPKFVFEDIQTGGIIPCEYSHLAYANTAYGLMWA